MAYLPCAQSVPVRAEVRAIDVFDSVGTWVIVALLGWAVWLEVQSYKRGN